MQDIIVNKKPKYKFVIQDFEGPLDLLLHLITKNKMNIFDISLSQLTDEYISYLDEMTEKSLEVASEFIVMAATLLDIKARKLLPEIEPKDEEDEIVSEEDIIAKIIEYKKYKEISNYINEIYGKNFGSFSKPFEKIKYKSKAKYEGDDFDKSKIFDIYISILQNNANKVNKKADEIEKIAIYEKVTVQDKVRQIVDYLNINENMVFNNIFDPSKCDNIEVVTAFLGALELSKLKQVDLVQNYLFSDINILKKENADFKISFSDFTEN